MSGTFEVDSRRSSHNTELMERRTFGLLNLPVFQEDVESKSLVTSMTSQIIPEAKTITGFFRNTLKIQ
jgi:hypothetical protein